MLSKGHISPESGPNHTRHKYKIIKLAVNQNCRFIWEYSSIVIHCNILLKINKFSNVSVMVDMVLTHISIHMKLYYNSSGLNYWDRDCF